MTSQEIRILGIDQDRSIQGAIGRALTTQGYTYRFIDGEERIREGLENFKPHLILLFGSIDNPFIHQAVQTIRADVRFVAQPIILVGGDDSSLQFCRNFRSGIIEILRKPYTPDTLTSAIVACLGHFAQRTGLVSGMSVEQLRNLVKHIEQFGRSGVLLTSPRTPLEGRANFSAGRLDSARIGSLTGDDALAKMLQQDKTLFTFQELSSGHGPVLADLMSGKGGQGQLPSPKPAAPMPEFDALPAAAAPPPQREWPIRMLVVDDDESLLKLFTAYFAKQGFRVSSANNGLRGAEAARSAEFDIILCDLDMPQLDGWGMLRLLGDDPIAREIPLVFLSAHDNYRESLRAMNAGARGYIAKGLKLDALADVVRKAIRPKDEFLAALKSNAKQLSFSSAEIGRLWPLYVANKESWTGVLEARDQFAMYRIGFRSGVLSSASAVAGNHSASGERALLAYCAAPLLQLTPAMIQPPENQDDWSGGTAELLTSIANNLAQTEQQLRESNLIDATSITVNKQLFSVYQSIAPKNWVEAARLMCEERLTPRGLLDRLNMSPIDIEQLMLDLVRRGVIQVATS